MPQMRLDKLLSHLNCGSRKEVHGAHSCGTRLGGRHCAKRSGVQGAIPDRSQTAVDGTVQRYRAQRYYMLNKPMGVITASRDERHDTVLELFPDELRRGLFAVGRLDKDTTGTAAHHGRRRAQPCADESEPPCRKGVRGGRGRRTGSGCSLAF